ncbi:hypothetical protein ACELLULO517_15650 [Acidisoma cellulosilytica]|uniref:Uncharacterized protein n=1 Tax=Acidisoma cellulosilyticum TaxID=2802395 RepID=A0A963Z4C0_9PROT|nr:hypothetical protein [Acidisoma cellulosilyticum]MCB8881682.1 hypothetical protein [Acidisoma cellulosilyticum]
MPIIHETHELSDGHRVVLSTVRVPKDWSANNGAHRVVVLDSTLSVADYAASKTSTKKGSKAIWHSVWIDINNADGIEYRRQLIAGRTEFARQVGKLTVA